MAWQIVCTPKSQGGLGLRKLDTWNEALMIKNLWNIVAGKESLWVTWVNMFKQGRSIWDVQKDKNESCMWKSILDSREKN